MRTQRGSVRGAPVALTAAMVLVGTTMSGAVADSAEKIPDLEVTAQMIAGSTLDLRLEGSAIDLRPDAATTGLETVREEEGETVMVLTSDLLFAFASAEISPQATAAVTDLIATIPQGAEVAVGGHTDSMGDDAVNVPLSQQRADAVAAVLRAERADLVLTVTGHGSSEPVADNTVGGEDSPSGRAQNRRVEITFASS